MGSLYRRYPSKEQLAQWKRIVGTEQMIALVHTALAEENEPWAAFARFLRDALSAQGLGAPLLPVLGGRLPATDEVDAAADRLRTAFGALVGNAQRAGVLRADFTSSDMPLLLEHRTPRLPVPGERAAALHLCSLDLVLWGLRTSADFAGTARPQRSPRGH
ncbi:TetR/AcrR family transcriptional regulator [Streptomyces noursei]|uniref:SbtR family transcriptional regulator n=1 Tax=Streptomyces noursei TaxID=1971 RepID=UPI00215536C4|nr:TetR/AcrR family transcriptional regulator [Streptomyces noursei]